MLKCIMEDSRYMKKNKKSIVTDKEYNNKLNINNKGYVYGI